MNFYEELKQEFENAGLKGEIKTLPKDKRPTEKDLLELERRIALRIKENEDMMFMSDIYAQKCMPVGKVRVKK